VQTYGDKMSVKIVLQRSWNRVVHQDQRGFADSDTVLTMGVNIVPALPP
jgi:hypothetical protein